LEFFLFQFKESCFSIYFRKEDNNSGNYNILILKFLFYVKCMREKINHATNVSSIFYHWKNSGTTKS